MYLQVRNNKKYRKNARNLKKLKSEARVSAETFPVGKGRYFAYHLHVADDTMPMHVYKPLCPLNSTP